MSLGEAQYIIYIIHSMNKIEQLSLMKPLYKETHRNIIYKISKNRESIV